MAFYKKIYIYIANGLFGLVRKQMIGGKKKPFHWYFRKPQLVAFHKGGTLRQHDCKGTK